jgi:hypothetical protein
VPIRLDVSNAADIAGAVLVWLFNAMAALIRGTGNLRVPAHVTIVGTLLLVPVSQGFTFGFGLSVIAGDGIASRLGYLMVPRVFGFGGPLSAAGWRCGPATG